MELRSALIAVGGKAAADPSDCGAGEEGRILELMQLAVSLEQLAGTASYPEGLLDRLRRAGEGDPSVDVIDLAVEVLGWNDGDGRQADAPSPTASAATSGPMAQPVRDVDPVCGQAEPREAAAAPSAPGPCDELAAYLYEDGLLDIGPAGFEPDPGRKVARKFDKYLQAHGEEIRSQKEQPWWKEVTAARVVGPVAPRSATFLFGGFENLASVDLSGLDTSACVDASRMFEGCSSLALPSDPAGAADGVSEEDREKIRAMLPMLQLTVSLEILAGTASYPAELLDKLNRAVEGDPSVDVLEVAQAFIGTDGAQAK